MSALWLSLPPMAPPLSVKGFGGGGGGRREGCRRTYSFLFFQSPATLDQPLNSSEPQFGPPLQSETSKGSLLGSLRDEGCTSEAHSHSCGGF